MLLANTEECLARLGELPMSQQREILATVKRLTASREKATKKTDFIQFVKAVWPGFIEGYHHKIMGEVFDRVVRGECKRVIINMAPRHTKSEFASHLFPAYFLGWHPHK